MWIVLNMFQIQLHIIKADFWRSEVETRRRRLGPGGLLPAYRFQWEYDLVSCRTARCNPTLDNSNERLLAEAVVFPLCIGGVFHVKYCVFAVIWSCVLHRLSAVIHNRLSQSFSFVFVFRNGTARARTSGVSSASGRQAPHLHLQRKKKSSTPNQLGPRGGLFFVRSSRKEPVPISTSTGSALSLTSLPSSTSVHCCSHRKWLPPRTHTEKNSDHHVHGSVRPQLCQPNTSDPSTRSPP